MTDAKRMEIAQALEQRGVLDRPCATCGKKNWFVLQHYGVTALRSGPSDISFSNGPLMACAVLVCEMCGVVSHFDMGRLGINVES
jgi:hypothetical protein